MRITKTAAAGTLESSDVLITVEPASGGGLQIDIEGATAARFGKQIRAVVAETLAGFGVTDCAVRLQDKGALDCTIRARLSAALLRAGDETGSVAWEALK
ncbi:MAG: citrate lyase acyl carrier protein [Treponema sp. GWC1_61_84]|nr:MAG: citrate lyase acyl carrier protein [Treponema sp. GWC1_61_84]